MALERVQFDINSDYVADLDRAQQALRDYIYIVNACLDAGAKPPGFTNWRQLDLIADACCWVIDNRSPIE